jgi:hypothetical protein
MKSTSMFLFLLCAPMPCFATDDSASTAPSQAPQQEAPNATMEVTETCVQKLQDINQDYGQLLYYFKGVFQSLVENERTDVKFSDLLDFFGTEASGINKTVTSSCYPATYYVGLINNKHSEYFNTEFKKQLEQQKDVKKTWLAMEDIFNSKLRCEIIDLKWKIATDDAEWVRLGKQGITRHGNTVYVNLSHPYYRNNAN